MNRTSITAALVLLASATAASAAPFAMVTDLKGVAWSLEGPQPQKLGLLAYIEKPTEVRLDESARLAVTYFGDGVQHSFVGPARLTLDAATVSVIEGKGSESRKVTPEKAIKGGLSAEQWRRLQQATVVMRVVRSSFAVVGPDKTTVLDADPEFEWNTVPDARGYRLVVYGAENKVLYEGTSEHPRMRAGTALALQPGTRYSWKVDALGVQKPVSARASFAVAEEPARLDAAAVKQSAGRDAPARAFYAISLEAQGYAHDARAEWKALARDFPDEAEFQRRAR
jgi:hypothetical protein